MYRVLLLASCGMVVDPPVGIVTAATDFDGCCSDIVAVCRGCRSCLGVLLMMMMQRAGNHRSWAVRRRGCFLDCGPSWISALKRVLSFVARLSLETGDADGKFSWAFWLRRIKLSSHSVPRAAKRGCARAVELSRFSWIPPPKRTNCCRL